jgi:FlaA1/EpsC-like NDP-sugar epimerase
MGKPVKINDLAHAMINLAGKSIRNEENPDGDIAIEYTGLRPGEKLYEELLIGDRTSPTRHPRIQQLDEPFKKSDLLVVDLANLEKHMNERDLTKITETLSSLVEGYSKKE